MRCCIMSGGRDASGGFWSVFRALRARARLLRRRPPRIEPRFARDLPNIRSYPDGYDIAALGTFPRRA